MVVATANGSELYEEKSRRSLMNASVPLARL
jgi:hypothetical protein